LKPGIGLVALEKSNMSLWTRSFFRILANLLIPIAVLVFATGFFPYKAVLPGLAGHDELSRGVLPQGQFDKIIFMVVDALRSDFVYSENSGFKFTQSLIRNGDAIPFTAHATSPTITMPRIKAITTGSVPSFLDVILNFAESDTTTTLAMQDTWLAQIHAKNKGKLVMYGDDTWLRLFPGMFMRADGTSSFFVSVSVDSFFAVAIALRNANRISRKWITMSRDMCRKNCETVTGMP
jgi:ethanolamine phosphate transferase 2 subunit G